MVFYYGCRIASCPSAWETCAAPESFFRGGFMARSIVQMIYWITTTISTVGYGDFSPTTVPARPPGTAFICI